MLNTPENYAKMLSEMQQDIFREAGIKEPYRVVPSSDPITPAYVIDGDGNPHELKPHRKLVGCLLFAVAATLADPNAGGE